MSRLIHLHRIGLGNLRGSTSVAYLVLPLSTADDMENSQLDVVKPSVRRDLFVVAVVTLSTFMVSSVLELNERLIAFTRPLEAYQIDELPTTFVAMIVALAWFSWRRSRQTIEQANLRLAAQRELAEALGENRKLSQRYLQIQEEERRFLARELHDELGQSLNAIKVDAVNIRDGASDLREVGRSAQAIIDVSSKVYEVVRSLLRRLRPGALDELGLASAVQYSAFIFDDYAPIRSMLVGVLKQRSYEVLAFARAAVCQTCPCPQGQMCADIIISDVSMPNLSGIQFVQHQKMVGCRNENILLISGAWSEENIRQARALGCYLLHKPFLFERLQYLLYF